MANYSPTEKEKDARKLYLKGLTVNGATNTLTANEAKSAKEAIEEDLEENLPSGYTARVVTALGDYFIFKFYKDGKVVTTYKSKDAADLETAITEARAFFTLMTTIPADKITASPATTTKVVGQTQAVTITASPSGASTTVTGVSSDTDVATVSGTTITAVGAGECTVTFTSTTSNATATVAVTVTAE